MRRGPGVVALNRQAESQEHFTSFSQEWNSTRLEELKAEIDQFSEALRSFAASHRRDIQRDPEFRHAFQRMCASLWVDPLAGHPSTGSRGGGLGRVTNLWNELTGFGDWQYELGVQIVDVCVSTRPLNGGLISMQALIDGVTRLRLGSQVQSSRGSEAVGVITEKDVERSVTALQPLGCGYEIIALNGSKLIRSVPQKMNADALVILDALASGALCPADAMGLAYVTVEALSNHSSKDAKGKSAQPTLPWSPERAVQALDDMLLNDGTLWLDIVPARSGFLPETSRRRYYSITLAETALRPSHT